MKIINSIAQLYDEYREWQTQNNKRIVVDGKPASPKCPKCYIPLAVFMGCRLGKTLLLLSEEGGAGHEEALPD
jgi:hypothetical protein